MSLTEDKRVYIYGYNVDKMNQNEIQEATKFVNKLLEQFFNQDLVEVEAENKESLQAISMKCNKKLSDIINSVLRNVEIVPPVQEKVKVELSDKIVKVKKKRISGSII